MMINGFPQLSDTTPSLVNFGQHLYCFYQGAGNSCLYFCRFNAEGQTWDNNAHVKVGGNDLGCINGCGVAVFNDETDPGMIVPRLICVHRSWGK